MTNERTGFRKTYLILAYVSVFFAYYILFLNQGLQHTGPLGDFFSETSTHMMFAKPFLDGKWLQELKVNFEPLLPILTAALAFVIKLISNNDEVMNLANAAALILSLAKTAQFIIVKKIIDESTNLKESTSIFLTFVINFSTVLYLPFITLNIYIPMITPNILVDPTNILLEPFAILFFYLYIKHYIKQSDIYYKKSFWLSLLLIITTLIKPAFTNIILVVIGIYYLLHPKRFNSSMFLHDIIIYLPSCIILVWQLFLIKQSAAGGGIEFAPYKVIGHYTAHPFIALFQALAFPLLISLVYFVKVKTKDCDHLHFAWIFCIIAYLIYALFSFSGPAWTAANLAWSYQIALSLLYMFSIIEYGRIFSLNKTKINPFLTNLCTVAFCLIFLSGIHQFLKVFLGGSYF